VAVRLQSYIWQDGTKHMLSWLLRFYGRFYLFGLKCPRLDMRMLYSSGYIVLVFYSINCCFSGSPYVHNTEMPIWWVYCQSWDKVDCVHIFICVYVSVCLCLYRYLKKNTEKDWHPAMEEIESKEDLYEVDIYMFARVWSY